VKETTKEFLFLEFLDPEINALLTGLRKEFSEKISHSNIHITVRGPYKKRLTKIQIDKIWRKIKNDIILICDTGLFNNCGFYIVYLKVKSENLRGIWWKPDFQVSKHGFNPHITMYQGNNKELAHKIKKFLGEENIQLLCSQFDLTPYVSKQETLFKKSDSTEMSNKQFLGLIHLGKIKADILQRAHNLVKYGEPTRKRIES